MIKLTGITWITTYRCNLACDHCFFDTGGKNVYMAPELVDRVLDGFQYGKQMFWQHLSGGEIFLDREKLFEIIKRIRKYVQKDLGISTNGFWASDEELVKNTVDKLVEFGVNGIAVSIDYYHQQQMPVDGPKNLIHAIDKSGLKAHTYLMGARLNNDVDFSEKINSISDNLVAIADQGFGIPLAYAFERSIGKGSLINKPKKKNIPDKKCTALNTCLGERSPFNPAMVWIDPYGNVMICYGLVIGNVFKKSFNEIIETYTSEENIILDRLARSGPKGLYALAKENGIEVPDEFYDECDLCYQCRSALKKYYPEILAPGECYPC